MRSFQLIDDINIASEFTARLDEMRSLISLQYLSMNWHPHLYAQITLKPFFDQFRAIRGVSFNFGVISLEQVDKFIKGQELPSNVQGVIETDYVHFVRIQ